MTTATTMTMTTTTATMTSAPTTEPPGRRWTLRDLLASTRLRLATTIVLVVLVAGVGVVIGVRTVLHGQVDSRLTDQLTQESEEFERFLRLGRDPAGGPVDRELRRAGELYLRRSVLDDDEAIVVIDRRRGDVQSLSPVEGYRLGDDVELRRRWLALDESRLDDIDTPAGEAKVLAVPVLRGGEREGAFVVAAFTEDDHAEADDALEVVVWAIGLSVLVVALASWFIAGRVLRPLRTMTETAQRISEEDLSQRLAEPGGNDEVAVLVRTFNSMLDRLEDALGTQRRFLADAGHDLRTPLTILRGHLEQLRAGMVPAEERDDTLTLVQDEVERMARLVDDLVVLARSQRPDFLRTGPVDVADLALAILRRAEAIPGPEWRAEPGVGVVEADLERLTQAALNLVTNAARYSPPGEPVVIGTELRAGEAALWVEDSGPGVSPRDRERIFQRHVRGLDRLRSGSGLGLAIARAIAEAHGGRLELETPRGGRGARFVMRFPAETVE
jgi:signal transduction histidine kinase